LATASAMVAAVDGLALDTCSTFTQFCPATVYSTAHRKQSSITGNAISVLDSLRG